MTWTTAQHDETMARFVLYTSTIFSSPGTTTAQTPPEPNQLHGQSSSARPFASTPLWSKRLSDAHRGLV